MRSGSKILFFGYVVYMSFLFQFQLVAQDKITSTPLINLEKLKPSFEETETLEKNNFDNNKIKKKNKNVIKSKSTYVKLIGLDKITAKSSEILLPINEVKKFGPLEIKILKCGKVLNNNRLENIAYMQVKDLTKNDNDKVYIFNGWTFASDPSLTPFDHAIYDLQLVSCNQA